MNKGEKNMTDTDTKEAANWAKAIEQYEDNTLKIMPMPVTINSVIQQKVVEMDITQNNWPKCLA